MFFTLDDYRKIENYIQQKSVKDTQFKWASRLTGEEIIAIVLKDKNVKLKVSDLVHFNPSNNFVATVISYNKLPDTANVQDVYTVLSPFTYDGTKYLGGTNVVWDGEKWIPVSAYSFYTKELMDTLLEEIYNYIDNRLMWEEYGR